MPRTNKTKSPNKSAFIRSLPRSMPAAEVVAKAKAAGLTLNDKYVYNIRAKGPKAGRPGRPKGSKNRAKEDQRGQGGGGAQSAFIDLALEIGLSRAESILGRLRSAIKSAALG